MGKDELVARMAEHTGLTKQDAQDAWKAAQKVIVEALRNGEEVAIAGVGKLKPSTRKAYTGRNPQTGERIDVPERRTIKLIVSSTFPSS